MLNIPKNKIMTNTKLFKIFLLKNITKQSNMLDIFGTHANPRTTNNTTIRKLKNKKPKIVSINMKYVTYLEQMQQIRKTPFWYKKQHRETTACFIRKNVNVGNIGGNNCKI